MTGFESIMLETKRLKLRCLNLDDEKGIFVIFSDDTVMRYWNTPPMTNIDQARQLIKSAEADYRDKTGIRFGLELKEKSELIGTCSLFNFHVQSRRAEIGYILGRDYWGSGLMHEALCTVLDYAFHELNLNRLEADIDPRNDSSRKSLLRLGFVKEGYMYERWIVGDEITDTEFFGLLRKKWNRGRI